MTSVQLEKHPTNRFRNHYLVISFIYLRRNNGGCQHANRFVVWRAAGNFYKVQSSRSCSTKTYLNKPLRTCLISVMAKVFDSLIPPVCSPLQTTWICAGDNCSKNRADVQRYHGYLLATWALIPGDVRSLKESKCAMHEYRIRTK